jgi:protein CpxP
MSLKSRFLSILTVVFAGLVFSTFTFAQDSKATTPAPEKDKADRQWNGKHGDHAKGEGRRGGGDMMRMFEGLNLTDAQKTQIHSILDANKPNREEMRALWEAKKNGTLTAEQQTRLDTLHQQMKANMKSTHEQILNVLTPEQKAQLKQRMQERHEQQEKAPAAATAPAQES